MSLNPNAPSFTFNPNAASFVPGQFAWSAAPAPAPAPAESWEHEEGADEAPFPAPSTFVPPPQEGPAVVKEITLAPKAAADPPAPAAASTPAPKAEKPVETAEKAEKAADEEGEEERETHKQRKERLEAEAEAELAAKDDPREHLNIVFIGHVDAGKSTMSGQVLYSTGMVDARTIEKYEQEAIDKNRSSWFLAYILDTNEEERAKGKTVEVGRAHFTTERKRYTIMDAPGHKTYVPNMIQGVAQADVGVLVISSRKGEFEAGFEKSGQTREHAILAKTLGIRKLIIAVNKMDDPTVNWSKERYDDIYARLSPFIKGIGFPSKDVIWIPVSGYTGVNVSKPVDKSVCTFYNGPTLLQLLDEMSPLERLDESPLRIPVLDKYKESGKVYILGKVESGVLRTNDEILIQPGAVKLPVMQIQNDENIITVAKPGENVKLILKATQVEEDSIARGSVVQHARDPPMPVTEDFVGQIAVMELLEHKSLLSAGYECVCHLHTATIEVNVVKLLDELDPRTGESKKKLPKFVQSKSAVIAHFKLQRAVPCEKFADFAQLGRFTLRDEGKTIAFGKILATNAPVRKLKQ